MTIRTGFQQLLDQGRFEIARQMLGGSAMEVIDIAALLDYADASAFTRAFRSWIGTTPARWRATRSGAAEDLRGASARCRPRSLVRLA